MMVENKLKLERMTEACVGMQREKKKEMHTKYGCCACCKMGFI